VELRGFAADMPLKEQASLRRTAASRSLAGSMFLSHSSKDEDLVVGATVVLENHGGRVYVDEVDPAMPPYTSEATADLLKRRIAQTKRFVLLASPTARRAAGCLGNWASPMARRDWTASRSFLLLRTATIGPAGNILASIDA
jgi:hypothetical protein